MAWKEGLRYDGPEARRIHNAAFPHAPLPPDKEIRITYEEYISECCEKWRGLRNVYRPTDFDPILADYAAKFCPECGNKL